MKDVRIVRFTSGEELICEIVNETESSVFIKNPYGIAPDPATGRIAVFPWSIVSIKPSDTVFEIYKHSIVMSPAIPPAEIVNSYIERTSGISIPSEEDKHLILG